MKNILTILSLTTQHIDIREHRNYIKITTLIEVKESDVQEMIDTIEEMGGEWYAIYNSKYNGIGMRVTFKTVDSEEYVKAAKVVNRHWFETRFKDNKNELQRYCEDVLIASK